MKRRGAPPTMRWWAALLAATVAALASCSPAPPTPLAPFATTTRTPTPTPTRLPVVPVEQAIQAHAVDPSLLDMVSKFRAALGHGSLGTPDWSSKHYFVPLPSLA
ncbi:MAG: hypothetical protein FJ318_00515 [SAR202 cluster bacterium]|nr:hypothetical protein [SAR202 cluster bacterium]